MDNLTAHKASEYDQKVRQTIPFYETIHAEVLRLVKLVKPDVKCWVDTGCGTGRLVAQALSHFPEARFILADPSEAMLEQTRGRLTNGDSTRSPYCRPLGALTSSRTSPKTPLTWSPRFNATTTCKDQGA